MARIKSSKPKRVGLSDVSLTLLVSKTPRLTAHPFVETLMRRPTTSVFGTILDAPKSDRLIADYDAAIT